MTQEWRNVTFLHWQVDPGHVSTLLPEGLTPDTFAGSAWVGLIGFEMRMIAFPGLPAIPYFGTFPETNVRTYVKDATGRPGVWFHSLEASRLAPVWVARTTYALPYMWAGMSIEESGSAVRYVTRRRWPQPRGAGGVMAVSPENAPIDPDSLAVFLTGRWGLYSTRRRGG